MVDSWSLIEKTWKFWKSMYTNMERPTNSEVVVSKSGDYLWQIAPLSLSLSPGVNFINVFTHSFYAFTGPKAQKAAWLDSLFSAFGICTH